MDTIADRIRFLIERGGFATLRDFSRAADLSEDHVHKILQRGGDRVGADTLKKLAAAGHVTIDWIVTGRGPDLAADLPLLGNLPGWTEAETVVRALKKRPEVVYQRARAFSALNGPSTASPELVLSAVGLAENFPTTNTDTPETAAARAEIARVTAVHEEKLRVRPELALKPARGASKSRRR